MLTQDRIYMQQMINHSIKGFNQLTNRDIFDEKRKRSAFKPSFPDEFF